MGMKACTSHDGMGRDKHITHDIGPYTPFWFNLIPFRLWFSIVLILQPFNVVPLVVVIPNHKIIFCCCFIIIMLLLLCIVMQISHMQPPVKRSFDPKRVTAHRLRNTILGAALVTVPVVLFLWLSRNPLCQVYQLG